MDPITVTFLVLLGAIVLFMTNVLPAPLTAMLVALTLFLTGTLPLEDALGGFGDPVIVYLASLFVISAALEGTGVTAWAGQWLLRHVGEKPLTVTTALMLLCAVFTAFISVDGAVASLVPVGVMLATRIGSAPSKLMMPLAFSAHAASMLTLLGTPLNVIVSEFAQEGGARGFGFFEFGIVGVPLLAGTVAITLLIGNKVLPDKTPEGAPADLSRYAQTLSEQYGVDMAHTRLSYEHGVTEVVVAPRSALVGSEVFPGMRTDQERLMIVGVQRSGRTLHERSRLRSGDVVLVRGTWDDLAHRATLPGIMPVNVPEAVRSQAAALGPRAYVALAVLAAMSIVLAVDVLPAAVVVAIAAVILVGCRILTVDQAQRSVSLPTIVVVAGMIPLSTAIRTTGAGDLIAKTLLRMFGGGSPWVLLVALVVVVMILGQFVSNLATVLIVAPVALTVASSAGVSPLPFLMAIDVAAAAAVMTPIANTANLMVQGPGGYRFGDFWKLGLPLWLFFGLMAVLVVPLVWHF